MNDIITRLRHDLQINADQETRVSAERFFKGNEKIRILGLKSALVKKIAREYLKEIKKNKMSKAEVYSLCDKLWQSGYLEEIGVACLWSEAQAADYQLDDFFVFAGWVNNYVTNWAVCDTLCNHTVGMLIVKYPHLADCLLDWAKSPNRWVRRASVVSLIVPAKRGCFFGHVIKLADILLTDTDDMVQKGYGWLLKSASATHERDVFDYVMKNKHVMPRTALRYAIEKMPAERRKLAMMV